jgi:hypothetical protein
MKKSDPLSAISQPAPPITEIIRIYKDKEKTLKQNNTIKGIVARD